MGRLQVVFGLLVVVYSRNAMSQLVVPQPEDFSELLDPIRNGVSDFTIPVLEADNDGGSGLPRTYLTDVHIHFPIKKAEMNPLGFINFYCTVHAHVPDTHTSLFTEMYLEISIFNAASNVGPQRFSYVREPDPRPMYFQGLPSGTYNNLNAKLREAIIRQIQTTTNELLEKE